VKEKKSQLQTTNGQTADPRRPKLVQPFFSLKEVVPVSPKLGGGELFYQAPGQRERERELKILLADSCMLD